MLCREAGVEMRRRDFFGVLSGTALSLPLGARAQQAQRQHRIAFVHSGIPADLLTETAGPFWVRQFYQTLRKLGDTEAGNLVVERYSGEGRSDRFAALAAAVVSRNPDVIVANSNGLVKTFMVYPDSSIIRKTACHGAIFGFVMGHDLRRLFVSR
jgi:putative tryptophan/tyrosine transport system substrate-binding protein